ncbi:VOC family protein [Pseudalkalibacillus hwajinpoensis]|uniref:VOC family protein n=1 Tax=Guptibacillus hwajinpoensis TaxID=208199 RepID=A0A4V5PZ33_9BACL|nr:VOC family protein [Pseudalkalibacillus hwajinpoensis]TKD72398.1 VOC family protein [Pseudalkalibacillus hwajinpoensis]
MVGKLLRIGTTYIPVSNVETSSEWYITNLEAEMSYMDSSKAILNIANQSLFLVKAKDDQSSNFYDNEGNECFSMTFEVDGIQALESIRNEFIKKKIRVGDIENRGHIGRNFVFYDLDGNKFDVWSEVSPDFKEKYLAPNLN